MSKLTKKLQWEELGEDDFGVIRDEPTIIPPYEVRYSKLLQCVVVRAGFHKVGERREFATIDEAKQACHDHFEALVAKVLV